MRPSRSVHGQFTHVRPLSPFVVVAEGWPSALITLLSLGLPVEGAFFPSKYHRHFKPRAQELTWHPLLDLHGLALLGRVVFIVSGSPKFARRVWPLIGQSSHTIVSFELERRDAATREVNRQRWEAAELCKELGLAHVDFSDEVCGGATDAIHPFGFGSGLGRAKTPSPIPTLPRRITYFLDGGTRGRFDTVPTASVPRVDGEPGRVLWSNSVLLPQGLLPCRYPKATVYCPTHFCRGRTAVRPLSLPEMLRLYQLPLAMDPLLLPFLQPRGPLPFESSASPDLFASILRQLWGEDTWGVGVSQDGAASASADPTLAPRGEEEELEGTACAVDLALDGPTSRRSHGDDGALDSLSSGLDRSVDSPSRETSAGPPNEPVPPRGGSPFELERRSLSHPSNATELRRMTAPTLPDSSSAEAQ